MELFPAAGFGESKVVSSLSEPRRLDLKQAIKERGARLFLIEQSIFNFRQEDHRNDPSAGLFLDAFGGTKTCTIRSPTFAANDFARPIRSFAREQRIDRGAGYLRQQLVR